eukprot:753509-Prorocentrum_minimum.AAC.3
MSCSHVRPLEHEHETRVGFARVAMRRTGNTKHPWNDAAIYLTHARGCDGTFLAVVVRGTRRVDGATGSAGLEEAYIK